MTEAPDGGQWRDAMKLKELFQRRQPQVSQARNARAKHLSPILCIFTPIRIEQRVPHIALGMGHRWAQMADFSVAK